MSFILRDIACHELQRNLCRPPGKTSDVTLALLRRAYFQVQGIEVR